MSLQRTCGGGPGRARGSMKVAGALDRNGVHGMVEGRLEHPRTLLERFATILLPNSVARGGTGQDGTATQREFSADKSIPNGTSWDGPEWG